jgi:DNA-binding phage protein
MATRKTAFSHYVAERKKKSAEFATAYEAAEAEIAQTDVLLQALDAERERLNMTKAELAKRAGMSAVSVRRLFTAEDTNPEVKTLMRLGQELGFVLDWKRAS